MCLLMSLQVSHVFPWQSMLGMVVPKLQRSRERNEIELSIKKIESKLIKGRKQDFSKRTITPSQGNDHLFPNLGPHVEEWRSES